MIIPTLQRIQLTPSIIYEPYIILEVRKFVEHISLRIRIIFIKKNKNFISKCVYQYT